MLCKQGVAGFDPGHVHQFCLIAMHLPDSPLPQSLRFGSNCARMRLLQCDCAHWCRQQNVRGHRCYFVGSTV